MMAVCHGDSFRSPGYSYEIHLTALKGMLTAVQVMVTAVKGMMTALEFMVRDVAVMLTAGDTSRGHADSCRNNRDSYKTYGQW